ncbi:MAG: asparagine synthase (glutamine-hydrolyzing) [Nitrospirae bacterium]|nr:asparagine synthase (glutamine-hydrolyzing) [Nitrospirota bacterium]
MCGIAGIIRLKECVRRQDIERMTRSLAHRGPDGEGIWLNDNVALGHRRLSIIDLKTGGQPMCNEDETVWITFNGEIYNYRELRALLCEKGHRFQSSSDTEVIVHAYEEWGDECVKRFRGMFAFGIVDIIRKKVFLARDYFGIKPLVYYVGGDVVAFASEIQALRQIEGIRLDLDLQGLDQYLWLQYIPAPHSIYKQIKKLPPAHRISITFDGHVSEPEEYWRLEFRPDHRKSEVQWTEELQAVLRESVKAHLVSDVSFGAFLSGGVDSSAIVAYMAQELGHQFKTFSIGFKEDEFNELKYAELVAKRWGTKHHFEIVNPNALEILPELVKHYGEPFGDSSAIPTYHVCKMARKYVPMVLSGDGGDEAFAGYHSYFTWMKYLEQPPVDNRRWWWGGIYALMRRLLPNRHPLSSPFGASLENWLSCINYMPTHVRRRLWRKEFKCVTENRLDLFEKEFERVKDYSNSNKVQYMDMRTYLPYDILAKIDAASMMNSLEVRTPFVDRKVVEFAATIPESWNIGKDACGEWRGKLLLKKTLEEYYPHALLHRTKMGFGIPIIKWFTTNGALNAYLHEKLLNPHSIIFELFEPEIVKQLLDRNTSHQIWLLLFLEEWLQLHRSEVNCMG